LKILKNEIEAKPARIDESGTVTSCAMISCTASEIFDSVKQGERIVFDDGKIEGVVKEVTGSEMLIKILQAKVTGTKLKADKGINLPDTELNLSGLTSKDKEDLRFVVQNADAVNVSFINSASDVIELFGELEKLGASKDLGVVLKIENQRAYENIIEILLAGMQRYPTGVMIARGDLAIETGWENMPRIQNELLRLCNSAYVPTVWATQVLENLAKNGVPSRSELTDAASSLKADCVMLNKGPYILNALNLLHTILFNMNSYRDKDVRMFEAIEPTQVPG
ncbi:MAG: pyruvate kinase, partial [Balneolales bacterium]|nr:pyruvate kinase [Balneolales bacterium]